MIGYIVIYFKKPIYNYTNCVIYSTANNNLKKTYNKIYYKYFSYLLGDNTS